MPSYKVQCLHRISRTVVWEMLITADNVLHAVAKLILPTVKQMEFIRQYKEVNNQPLEVDHPTFPGIYLVRAEKI